MQASITKEQVRHIAGLANLSLTDKELDVFRRHLSQILGYMQLIFAVDIKNVVPTSQVTGLKDIKREDKAEKSLLINDALANAKVTDKNFISTKAVFNE